MHGNWMQINASDMSIQKSGFYQNGVRVGFMKDGKGFKNFTRKNVFYDFDPKVEKMLFYKSLFN